MTNCDDQERPTGVPDQSLSQLNAEIEALSIKLSALKEDVAATQNRLNSMLLKQIEILTVFIAVVTLIITNVVGLDAFGNIGIKGLIRIDVILVVSVLVILAGVKIFIVGFRQKQ